MELKIGMPIAIVTEKGNFYNDYYYLGNGVIGTMNLPYKTNEIFFIPSFNVFKEDWIKYVVPCKNINDFLITLSKDDVTQYLKSNIIDGDNLENCLYAKEGFFWWNDNQKNEIKSCY